MSLKVLSKMFDFSNEIQENNKRYMYKFETPAERKERFKRKANEMGLTHGKGKRKRKNK